MNCSDFQKRCEQAVEAHGPTASEQMALAGHASSCGQEQCRLLWQQTEKLAEAIRCWRADVGEVDLTDRVLDRLRQEQLAHSPLQTVPPLDARCALVQDSSPSPPTAAPDPTGSRLWVSLVTLAAALLVVASALTLTGPGPQEMASSPLAPAEHLTATNTSPSPEVPTTSSARALERELAGTYASMPLSATQFLTDAVVLVVPGDLSEPEEEPSPADLWAERLEERWEPIGRELNRSLEVLINAVPRTETAS